jgi:formiminoglutamase
LGTQPHAAARDHVHYARERGCIIRWLPEVEGEFEAHFQREAERLEADGCRVYVTLDADVVRQADVPGVSAPNPSGLAGAEVLACARWAGQSAAVASLDLVEINPRFDRDGQALRWAALAVWNFLIGLKLRPLRGTR